MFILDLSKNDQHWQKEHNWCGSGSNRLKTVYERRFNDFVSNLTANCGDELDGRKLFFPWRQSCTDYNTFEAYIQTCRVPDSLWNIQQRMNLLIELGFWAVDSENKTIGMAECLRKMGSKWKNCCLGRINVGFCVRGSNKDRFSFVRR